ncbi:hypothetical protein ABK040_000781 [Willaertia magna]
MFARSGKVRSQTAYVPKQQQTNKKKELTGRANTRKQANKLEQNLIERNTTQNLIVNKTDTNSILTRLDLYSKGFSIISNPPLSLSTTLSSSSSLSIIRKKKVPPSLGSVNSIVRQTYTAAAAVVKKEEEEKQGSLKQLKEQPPQNQAPTICSFSTTRMYAIVKPGSFSVRTGGGKVH